jgi:AcrR family transcriptional regulator
MTDTPRAKRPYNAPQRRAQAARTRARIVEAAHREFLAHGYTGATIPGIAAAAGVAVETVYRSAAGKAGLLEAAVQAALAGGPERAEVPVEERPAIRKVIEETDPRRQLAAYAATQPGVWGRVGPLLRVLNSAAVSEPALAQLQEQHARQRLEGLRRFAALLDERGALRPGLTADRAADIIWTVCGQATYDSLVTARGWTPDEFRDWLAETLSHALLDQPH